MSFGVQARQAVSVEVTNQSDGLVFSKGLREHENGVILLREIYSEDQPQGIHIQLDSTGVLVNETCFLDGKLLK